MVAGQFDIDEGWVKDVKKAAQERGSTAKGEGTFEPSNAFFRERAHLRHLSCGKYRMSIKFSEL